jgi:hypothetical protein
MIKFILLFCLVAPPVMACEDHVFFRVGAGKQGQWLTKGGGDWNGDDNIAAMFALGYRQPIKKWLWWDIQATHNSQWDRGWPVDNRSEDELTSITIGAEFRLY